MENEQDFSRRIFLAAAGTGLLASAVKSIGATPIAPPDKQPAFLKLPGDSPKPIGWALVGLGQLCLEEVLPAFAECAKSKPAALVSGHPEKARTVAKHYGIPESSIYDYDNIEKIKDNAAVDVVYIILPNSMHAEYTIKALQAGKHVMCEKPMAATTQECRRMIEAANNAGKQLAVAYRLHHEPYNLSVTEMCAKRAYGPIKLIEAANNQVTRAPNIRLSRDLAGGALMDVGIYCINAGRYITGEEPDEVQAFSYRPKDNPNFAEVDESVAFTMKYPSGVMANCLCSLNSKESRHYRVHCERGYIDLENAFAYKGQRLNVGEAESLSELKLSPVNHFAAEMDKFSACILENKPTTTPGEMGLRDMVIIEALNQSLADRRPVRVVSDPMRSRTGTL